MSEMNNKGKENLAIFGGKPAINHPFPPMYPGGMRIGVEEEEAVIKVLRSKRLFRYYGFDSGSSQVATLEQEFAARIGTQYCVAVTSGTASLISALAGWAIGPGDEVIVPAYTWISTASAVLAVGAVPIIAEVDDSLTLDCIDVEKKITCHTKAIIAVHMRGAPCNLNALKHLSQKYNVKLLEDVAQAIGGSYGGKQLGSIGDAGAFSLQFNKIITCGEGGLITSSDQDFFQRVSMYQDVAGGVRNKIPSNNILPGINFRMSELHGAIALVQLNRLDGILSAMRHHKSIIKESMDTISKEKNINFRLIYDQEGDTSTSLIFYLSSTEQAKFVTKALRAEGAPTRIFARLLYNPERLADYHIYRDWSPILLKKTWSAKGSPWSWHEGEVNYTPDMCPRSLDLLGRAVEIDISPDLTTRNTEELISALFKVLKAL